MKSTTILEEKANEKLRICVYVRLCSYGLMGNADKASAIQNYYNRLAEEHENWEIVDSYIDEGRSNISFQAMVNNAKAGEYDIIITPSFARLNLPLCDIADVIKELKALEHPVGIYFEIEQVYSLDKDAQDKIDLMMLLANWEHENKTRTMLWNRKVKSAGEKDGGI